MRKRRWVTAFLLSALLWNSYTGQVCAYMGGLGNTAVSYAAALPTASGTQVAKNDNAVIDYSNTADGYIMVDYTASTSKRLKVQVTGPKTTYTYDLPAGVWTTFPLSDGNGGY